MAGMTWRWRVAAAASASAAVLALAACGGDGTPDSPQTSATNGGQLGGAPSASATTQPPSGDNDGGGSSGGGGNDGGGGGGGGSQTPTYPKQPGDYAVAFMTAVSANDTTRINALAEQAAVLQATGGHGTLSGGWSVYSCSSPDANNLVGCTVRNKDGDDARIMVKGSQLGSVAAITDVQLDVTTYPSDPVGYVQELLSARNNDNKQRVARLSTSTMFGKLTCSISGSQSSSTPTGDGFAMVEITGIGSDYGKSYQFKILANPGGKPNAIKDVTVSC